MTNQLFEKICKEENPPRLNGSMESFFEIAYDNAHIINAMVVEFCLNDHIKKRVYLSGLNTLIKRGNKWADLKLSILENSGMFEIGDALLNDDLNIGNDETKYISRVLLRYYFESRGGE